MTKFLFYIAISSLFIFSSCSNIEVEEQVFEESIVMDYEGPLAVGIADFTIDNTNGHVNEKDELLLSNNSMHAVSYHWDFGNGDTSSEASPIYEYKNHGTFTVKLTTTDANGNQDVVENDILVFCLFAGQDHGNN